MLKQTHIFQITSQPIRSLKMARPTPNNTPSSVLMIYGLKVTCASSGFSLEPRQGDSTAGQSVSNLSRCIFGMTLEHSSYRVSLKNNIPTIP